MSNKNCSSVGFNTLLYNNSVVIGAMIGVKHSKILWCMRNNENVSNITITGKNDYYSMVTKIIP